MIKETPEICSHCNCLVELRNPSGFCDHLYYPESCALCLDAKNTKNISVDDTPWEQFARAGHEKGVIVGRRQVIEELRQFVRAKIEDIDEKERAGNVVREAISGKVFRQDDGNKTEK